MPVGFTHEVFTGSGTDAQSYPSTAFTPAAGKLLVVEVAVDGNVEEHVVTDSQGGTYFEASSAQKASGADRISVHIRNSLVPAAVSTTVTVAGMTVNATGCNISVTSVSGMVRTGALARRQAKANPNNVAATPVEVVLNQACLTDNGTVAVMGNSANPAGMTPPTGWTELLDNGHATPNRGLEYAVRVSGFSGTTVSWGSASGTGWGAIVVELDGTIPVTLTAVAVGVATMTGMATHQIALVAIAVASPVINLASTYFKALVATAVGVPGLTTSKTIARVLTAVAVGVATFVHQTMPAIGATVDALLGSRRRRK